MFNNTIWLKYQTALKWRLECMYLKFRWDLTQIIEKYIIDRICFISIRKFHDDVIKWKHFPRYWPFVWGIHRWPVNSPHKGQWRGALTFSLICAWINGSVNNGEAGDLRRYRSHYDAPVMFNHVFVWTHSRVFRMVGCNGYIQFLCLQIANTIMHESLIPLMFISSCFINNMWW